MASFLLLAALAATGAEWHSFTNTDGSRRFDAELIACDSRAGTVTVVMQVGLIGTVRIKLFSTFL